MKRIVLAALLITLPLLADITQPPVGDGSAEPFLNAAGDSVLLSWLEPVANTDRVALRFARLRNGTWSAARTVVERSDLLVNWADFPSIVEDANGALFVQWLQKSKSPHAYDVYMSASTDHGHTWLAPFLLNKDGKIAEHGFASLAALPRGGAGVTWLDGRNMKPGAHEHEGEMALRYATIDAKGRVSGEVELDRRTCECCATGMTMTPAGPVITYRDRSAKEVRDISSVRHTSSGWSKPSTVSADGWKIEGCPVNGPQMDSIGNRVAVAWFTAAGDRARVLVAFSDDGGGKYAKPVQVDDGKPVGRVDVVMLDADTAMVAWIEQSADGAEIRSRRVTRSGTTTPSTKIAGTTAARAAGFVRLARVGSHVYFAWTDQSATAKRVKVAVLRWSAGGPLQRPVNTFSIVARDAATGQIGVAVQSHWFAVGQIVPWAEAGVGAVATQSFVDPLYGKLGLDLLRAGKPAPDALRALLGGDPSCEVRQVAMVDATGSVATFTGARDIIAAGGLAGNTTSSAKVECGAAGGTLTIGRDFAVQANLMANDRVWPAMQKAYGEAKGDLADRMLAALDAAQAAGGDIRGKQSAALVVVSAKSTGRPWQDRVFDLRVDDHPQPLAELRRLVALQRAYNHMNAGDLAVERKDNESALREYAAAEQIAANTPGIPESRYAEMIFWHAVALVNMNRVDESLPLFARAFRMEPGWRELTPRLPKSGLLPDDKQLMERILAAK